MSSTGRNVGSMSAWHGASPAACAARLTPLCVLKSQGVGGLPARPEKGLPSRLGTATDRTARTVAAKRVRARVVGKRAASQPFAAVAVAERVARQNVRVAVLEHLRLASRPIMPHHLSDAAEADVEALPLGRR